MDNFGGLSRNWLSFISKKKIKTTRKVISKKKRKSKKKITKKKSIEKKT